MLVKWTKSLVYIASSKLKLKRYISETEKLSYSDENLNMYNP